MEIKKPTREEVINNARLAVRHLYKKGIKDLFNEASRLDKILENLLNAKD